MAILVSFTYVIFNFRAIFGIGIFNAEGDYYNSYSDGSAGINLHLRINRNQDLRYYIYPSVESISTGNVANHGILSIQIYYLNDNQHVYAKTFLFSTPLSSYTMDRIYIELNKYDNLTCRGTIELSLETGGIPINDTVNFQLTYIIPLGLEDYMNLTLGLYVLFFLPFFLYVIVPVVLMWIFKPAFGLNPSEEEMKRDEKYLQYLHEHIKQKRKEEIY